MNPFANCINYWAKSHGTPQVNVNPNQIAPNINHASMYASAYNNPTTGFTQLGEGIAIGIKSTITGSQYSLSFLKRFYNDGTNSLSSMDDFYFVLLTCAQFQALQRTGTTSQDYIIPAIPSGAQIIYQEANMSNTNWQNVTQSFVANNEYDVLWIFPKMTTIVSTAGGLPWLEVALPELKKISFCNTQCITPTLTPAGPIDYYYMWENGPAIGIKLTSSSLTGNRWYKNGILLPNETQQKITVHESGSYTVSVNNCFSAQVIVTNHPYGPFSLPFSEHIMPVQSPGYYCTNSTDIIKQFDLGPSANYTWDTNPYSSPVATIQIDPSTYNIHSPNANVIIGNYTFTNDEFVQATADLNGYQKVLDYFINLSPKNIELPSQRCRNTNYSVYANWNTQPWTLPGGTKFDYENYDFGANGVIVAPPPYAGLHQVTIPGNSPLSEPLQVRFTNDGYMNYHFYYAWGGCYKRSIPIQIVCGRTAEGNNTDVKIYPNPAKDKITITSTDAINLIEISDLMSPTLKRIKVNSSKSITITLLDFKPGVYNCKITTSKGVENQKLIINQ